MVEETKNKWNSTILKFMSDENLIREYKHWLLVYRYNQLTKYSLILLAKSNSTNFYQLENDQVSELGPILKKVEATLCKEFDCVKVNLAMLMLIDKHVHLHVFPRFDDDKFWPGPIDVTQEMLCTQQEVEKRIKRLKIAFGDNDEC